MADVADLVANLTPAALDRLRRVQAEDGGRLDTIAHKLGLIAEADLAACYARHLGSPLLTQAEYPSEPVAADRLHVPSLPEVACCDRRGPGAGRTTK